MGDQSPGRHQFSSLSRDTSFQRGISTSLQVARYSASTTRQYATPQHQANESPVPALAQLSTSNVRTNACVNDPRYVNTHANTANPTYYTRPSATNQSIVSALTKSRTSLSNAVNSNNGNHRIQFNHLSSNSGQTGLGVKRLMPTNGVHSHHSYENKQLINKMQRVMNHRIVRSKLLKEKYSEHLMESYFLDNGGNILELYQFAKKPKSTAYLAYLKENSIEPFSSPTIFTSMPSPVPPLHSPAITRDDHSTVLLMHPPAATSLNALPGLSPSHAGSYSRPKTNSQNNANQTDDSFTMKCSMSLTDGSYDSSMESNNMSFVQNVSNANQEQIVEKAKQEAYVVQRINDLQRDGLWSDKRLPKVQDMNRSKAHWDFLLEEMVWLAADFAQERKWKKAAAKKCSRMVQKYFQDKTLAAQRAEKAQEHHLRRVAAFCAKEIRLFWNNVEKLVQFKQNAILEQKRRQALDQQLSFIVDQTEKYSQLLAEGMNTKGEKYSSNQTLHKDNFGSKQVQISPIKVDSMENVPLRENDDEFRPNDCDDVSEDDEETIELEEQIANQTKFAQEEEANELALLKKESEMDFEDFIKELPKDYLQHRYDSDNDTTSINSVSDNSGPQTRSSDSGGYGEHGDSDFALPCGSDEDEEETIDEQEKTETNMDYKDELDELNADNELSIEQLRRKYNASIRQDHMDIHDSDQSLSCDSSSEFESSEDEVCNVNIKESRDIGLKSLLMDLNNDHIHQVHDDTQENKLINDAAAIAESIQPKGNTLSSTEVSTKIPFLLKLTLREYQHIGLHWLVTMYDRKLNGILADEMGLGKTIQTIALLAHLACEKENWGPHLIVVPTSVMLNWEMECKKWSPAFKILTYYGSPKERKLKRIGWTKPNAFHICITSYKLVIQDHKSFRRKKWKYLILDEAQNIKNFKSQRWQLLLNFQSNQRLLLTGTPLQNNLMELWSLMHFLMPNVFQSHSEFKEWFSNPVTGMIEGNSEYNEKIIRRLHKVLRPFLLRRLKCEVEKQMPKKYEHVIMCRLSKRQRFLYDDYMSRVRTQETLKSGNLLSVINVLMQLRKVCNHPNLFEVRPTVSPFFCDGIIFHIPSIIFGLLDYDVFKNVNIRLLFNLIMREVYFGAYQSHRTHQKQLKVREMVEVFKGEKHSAPSLPPCHLYMRVRKHANSHKLPNSNSSKLLKMEKDGVVTSASTCTLTTGVSSANTVTVPNLTTAVNSISSSGLVPIKQNMKLKFSPQLGVQFVQQQAIVKAIPVSLSQQHGNTSTVTYSSSNVQMLKPPVSFAQLVQTSTGKHLLLTSNPTVTTNIPVPVSSIASGGQKLQFVSKQAVNTSAGTTPQVTKAVMKIQLTSVTVAAGSSSLSTTSSHTMNSTQSVTRSKHSHNRHHSRQSGSNKSLVGSKYIDQLYGIENKHCDVRWKHESLQATETELDILLEDVVIENRAEIVNRLQLLAHVNTHRCDMAPLYGWDLRECVKVIDRRRSTLKKHRISRYKKAPSFTFDFYRSGIKFEDHNFKETTLVNIFDTHPDVRIPYRSLSSSNTKAICGMFGTPQDRLEQLSYMHKNFIVYVPAARCVEPQLHMWRPSSNYYRFTTKFQYDTTKMFNNATAFLHPIASLMSTQLPDPRLIQYDCGKLQRLDNLLRELKSDGHRVLIFTQMSKMLDVLEAFLNYHGYIYLRLDGTTKVDQRQFLMERFNGDKRIFVFILSTRSGGVGVNLTGADTVIFYDSDWNPTMDAQAQDRCHRIGQTRDVHIYRLISERTIEENILKKANQKRLLGDLAIEGGNFTTAYFKSSTIQDLFNLDNLDGSANSLKHSAIASKAITEINQTSQQIVGNDDKGVVGIFENALAQCEDDQDVQAANTAKAEAVADLAEFDENIPIDQDSGIEQPEASKTEHEINNLIKKLSPIERYAMRFIEETESNWSAQQLAAAEREIEEQKREWEQNRLAAMKEEEQRRLQEQDEENNLLTFSREDSTNKVWVSELSMEQMPMWCPPTPPQQDTDVYIDHTINFLYEYEIMPEVQLPPIYNKKEQLSGQAVHSPQCIQISHPSNLKRSRSEAGFPLESASANPNLATGSINSSSGRRPLKYPRRDDIFSTVPRSIFHASLTTAISSSGGSTSVAANTAGTSMNTVTSTISKFRRDLKWQKYHRSMMHRSTLMGGSGGGCAGIGLQNALNIVSGTKIGSALSISQPTSNSSTITASKSSDTSSNLCREWTIYEDMTILKVIQTYQGFPLSLFVPMAPAHTPNWDLVADCVNMVSVSYRSPKQCRHRYESIIVIREEGKAVSNMLYNDISCSNIGKKKSNKNLIMSQSQQKMVSKGSQIISITSSGRSLRTSQLYIQDNNNTFSQHMGQRYDILKSLVNNGSALEQLTHTSHQVMPLSQSSPQIPQLQRHASSTASSLLTKNAKHTAMLHECGIDIEHPLMPTEVAQRRAERLAREKKPLTIEQQQLAARLQLLKNANTVNGSGVTTSCVNTVPHTQTVVTTNALGGTLTAILPPPSLQTGTSITGNLPSSNTTTNHAHMSPNTLTLQQQQQLLTNSSMQQQAQMIGSSGSPSTPPRLIIVSDAIRAQRLLTTNTSPIPGHAGVVSVSGLSPAQIQAATQRLIAVSQTSTPNAISSLPTIQNQNISPPTQSIQQTQQSHQQYQQLKGATIQQQNKTISPTQLQLIRQQANLKSSSQLRLPNPQGAANSTTVSIPKSTSAVAMGGQPAILQFTQQAQNQRTQFIRHANNSSLIKSGAAGLNLTRTLSDGSEANPMIRKQFHQKNVQQQQPQHIAAQVFSHTQVGNAQAHQGSVAHQVATLVKAVTSNANAVVTGMNFVNVSTSKGMLGQTSNAGIATAITPTATIKATTPQQIRQLHIQQQLLAQKKIQAQKLNMTQLSSNTLQPASSNSNLMLPNVGTTIIAGGKTSNVHPGISNTISTNLLTVTGNNSNIQTQLIVGSTSAACNPTPPIATTTKTLPTAMTVQQFTQVMRSTPLMTTGIQGGSVVLTKGCNPRVIPVNANQGAKQTIQVVATASTSQALRQQGIQTPALLPHTVGSISSQAHLAGALAGLKHHQPLQIQQQIHQPAVAAIATTSCTSSTTNVLGANQTLFSQVSAALQSQNVHVRQGSPVRLQTASGTSIVALTVPQNSTALPSNEQGSHTSANRSAKSNSK